MPKLSDLPVSPPRILIYSPIGTGKSALGLTLGERGHAIDLADGLIKVARTTVDQFSKDRMEIDVRPFREEDPVRRANAFAQLKSYVYGLPTAIKNGQFKHKALLLDDLSMFGEYALAYIMGNSGKLPSDGSKPNPQVEIQHWGLAFNEMKNVLTILKTLPIPFILTAHDQIIEVGKGMQKDQKIKLGTPGKNEPQRIAKDFDEVWYLISRPAGGGKFQRVIQTVNDDIREAKSRSNIPNYTDVNVGLWKLIEMTGYKVPA